MTYGPVPSKNRIGTASGPHARIERETTRHTRSFHSITLKGETGIAIQRNAVLPSKPRPITVARSNADDTTRGPVRPTAQRRESLRCEGLVNVSLGCSRPRPRLPPPNNVVTAIKGKPTPSRRGTKGRPGGCVALTPPRSLGHTHSGFQTR